MHGKLMSTLGAAGVQFIRRKDGSVLPLFALLAIPIFASVGAGIDYSRASAARTQMQAALDAAVIAGAKDGSANWTTVALNVFTSNPNTLGATVGTPSFAKDASGNFTGSVSGSMPTSVLGVMSISSIGVSAASSAAAGTGTENSCILTMDHGQAASDQSLVLDGSPNISLTGCGLRSNTSMTCNGHNGNANASIAYGSLSGCSNSSHGVQVPDIYAGLNTQISFQCPKNPGSGATWDAGAAQRPAGLITVTQTYGTEYHVCGDLTLAGTGTIGGSTSDTIIVVENGSLSVGNDANVTTLRTVIILTGDNSLPSTITFPNGNGHAATISVSPPTDTSDPWRGISVYQDPVLTNTDAVWGVGDAWGPGATFNGDGVIYLPRSNVTWHGSGSSANNHCTKFVVNTFTTDGSVNLNFAQSTGCTTLGVQQWVGVPLHLAQ